MMTFRGNKLEEMRWPNETVQLLGRIAEFKGKHELFRHQIPELLQALKESAIIQSAESSNRIEGITVSPKRLTSLMEGKTEPQTRSEGEIAGYRDVLATIHSSARYMVVRPSLLLQMHRDLLQYATGTGGRFKTGDNVIEERLPTGEHRVRFVPVAAWRTPEAIDELTQAYLRERDRGRINELILIACFVLDFLCIHPFTDGNGRMARLLTLLLLYQSGHEVGRYISLERVVEESKEQYYEALERSSRNWHTGEHDLLPWVNYFLVMLLKSYQRFEDRVGQTSADLRRKGWKSQQVKEIINRMMADFTVADVQERCPGVSRPTIQRTLNTLSQEGAIECVERGRNARWRKR